MVMKVYREEYVGTHRSENAGMSSEKDGENPVHRALKFPGEGSRPPQVVGTCETERCIRWTTVDIPVLEYVVMEGR